MIGLWISAALAGAPAAAAQEAPLARALWSISSDDCVSVHADGDPWDECGFQAYAINHRGDRVLTVSATGTIQLWDGDGRELRRIDWPDQPSGASGYPSGRVIISGNRGVAIAHYNQIAVFDLAAGEILSKRVAEEMMVIDELRLDGDRLLVSGNDREWKLGIREIALPGGEIRTVPRTSEWTVLEGIGPAVWLTGSKAPFKLHSSRPPGIAQDRLWTCVPAEGRFCFRRDTKGRFLHVVDVSKGDGGRSVDTGRVLTDFDIPYFAVAAGHPMAVLCERAPDDGALRTCRVFDLVSGKAIHEFKNDNLRVFGAADEEGRPELRLALYLGEQKNEHRRVGLDGRMRIIDSKGQANLMAPGGGLVLPVDDASSLFIDARGRAAARLPFSSRSCGNGWPDWTGDCRFSGDGRRWLLPLRPKDESEKRGGLTLVELPAAGQ
jgi:WD40 repeat protein